MQRLKVLRLVVSHTQLYRKLDEFGKDYDKSVKSMVHQESAWMDERQPVPASESHGPVDSEGEVINASHGAAGEPSEADVTGKSGKEDSDDDSNHSSDESDDDDDTRTKVFYLHANSRPSGQKITIDNIDYSQKVHHMTQDQQIGDNHYLAVCATTNRVSGNHLN